MLHEKKVWTVYHNLFIWYRGGLTKTFARFQNLDNFLDKGKHNPSFTPLVFSCANVLETLLC